MVAQPAGRTSLTIMMPSREPIQTTVLKTIPEHSQAVRSIPLKNGEFGGKMSAEWKEKCDRELQ